VTGVSYKSYKQLGEDVQERLQKVEVFWEHSTKEIKVLAKGVLILYAIVKQLLEKLEKESPS